MKKLLIISMATLTLCGCATKKVEVVEDKSGIPNDKYVVTKNLDEALNKSEKRIMNNWALLRDVESKRALSPQVLQHNNNLDARTLEDKRKIVGPQLGSGGVADVKQVSNVSINKEVNVVTKSNVKGSDPVKVAKFNNMINKLKWQNSSLNELVGQVSKEVGYELVVVPGKVGDINMSIDIVSPNTILRILDLVAKINEPLMELTVSHVRQTITVKYK